MESYERKRLSYNECRELNKGKKANVVGERFTVTSGAEVEVLEYEGSRKVSIRFKSGQTAVVGAGDLRRGSVRDVFSRSVYGVGYLGGFKCGYKTHQAAYESWRKMIQRAYCPNVHKRQPSYIGVTVCEEWHNFQNFVEWWLEQPNAGRKDYHLDKDLINEGARQYNPDNCSFVPRRVNILLTDHRAARGELPVGVSRQGSGYQVQLSKDGNLTYLGYFSCLDTAARAYRKAKAEHVRDVANNLTSDEVVQGVMSGLRRWADNLMT